MHPQSTAQQTAIDLSHEGVDRILAALAEAGQFVHYNETDGDTFIDIWLTDLDADAPTVLGWRDSEGWQLRSWTSNDTDQPPARKWPIEVGSPADVARDVAAVFAKGEELSADAQETWFFTFGSGQQNDGKYVVIPGSYDEARDVMLAHFGNAWSFQYASPERAGVEEFGMVELPRSEWPPTDDEISDEIDEAFAGETSAQPELDPRQRLAAELHRIADDIVNQRLPLGHYPSLRFGVVDSRTDLDRWADYLGTTLDAPDSTGIPSVTTRIQLGDTRYGPALAIGVQAPKEQSELERLRAENARLQAQLAEGGADR